MNSLLKFFGVSRSDEKAVKTFHSPLVYLLICGYRSLLRLVGNHCIVPALRIKFFRLSGITIGADVQINMNVNFLDDFVKGLITIRNKVSIAPSVSFVASSHPNNSLLFQEHNIIKTKPIIINDGAWIGVGTVILPGITIGKCAIIGANSVVTKDVADYTIVAGNPAKKIGKVKSHEKGKRGSNV